MSWFNSAASKEAKAKAKVEAEAAEAARAARAEAARVRVMAAEEKWEQWNKEEKIAKEVRESKEAAAEAAARTKINDLADKNNQEIEKIFNEKFNPLKESIEAQFKEISDNIKKDLNNVIGHSIITLNGLKIDLATITINHSLHDVDTLLEYLNPKNLVNMLNTYEEQCKTILKTNLGSEVATVTVTKKVGEPEPPKPYTLVSTPVVRYHGYHERFEGGGYSTSRGNRDNPYGYRGGGSSKSSKKRKPIKKRRNTKRRM